MKRFSDFQTLSLCNIFPGSFVIKHENVKENRELSLGLSLMLSGFIYVAVFIPHFLFLFFDKKKKLLVQEY
jgi:hypothetical protein